MAADRTRFGRTSRVLVIAMFGVVSSFLASAIYSHQRLSSAVEVLSIATNAAPSIRYVANASMHLHRLAFQLEREVAVDGASDAVAIVERERKLFAADLAEYYKLPAYPGERELQQPLKPMVAALDAGVRAARDRIVAGDNAGARTIVFQQLGPVLDELDDKFRQLVELDGDHLEADTTAIQLRQMSQNRIAYLLYGSSVLIALLATLLVIRNVRRYFLALDRRARELEYFAIQVGHDILNPLTAISAGLHLAGDREATDEQTHTALERSHRAVDRIGRQISTLRSFAYAEERSPPDSSAAVRPALDGVLVDLPCGASVVCEPGEEAAVQCTDGVLGRILRAMLTDAVARSAGEAVRVQVRPSGRRVRIEMEGGPATRRGVDLFAAQIRGPDSGYPGIELGMLSARRLAEAHEGAVGNRSAVPTPAVVYASKMKLDADSLSSRPDALDIALSLQGVFDGESASGAALTARPNDHVPTVRAGDDEDAATPDDLAQTWLAKATESERSLGTADTIPDVEQVIQTFDEPGNAGEEDGVDEDETTAEYVRRHRISSFGDPASAEPKDYVHVIGDSGLKV